jgi:hypothetical protein
LVEEIRRDGQVEFFYMYNSEHFLQYSKQYLQAEVSEESIGQVREAKIVRMPPRFEEIQRLSLAAEEAVFEWLSSRYPSAEIERNTIGFPDFVVYEDGRRAGFELKVFRDSRSMVMRLRETVYRAYYEVNEGNYESITIVLAMEEIEAVDEAIRYYHRQKNVPLNVKVLFGVLEAQDEPNLFSFRPVTDISGQRGLFDEV